MVVCICLIVPVPWHILQVSTLVPGFAPFPWHTSHVSSLVIIISFSTPVYASSKVISIFTFKSAPFVGDFLLVLEEFPNPPPKNDEKMSPKSPKSLNPSNPELVYE